MEILNRVLEQQAGMPKAVSLPQDAPAQVEADSDEEGFRKFVADLGNCVDDELGSEEARSWEPPPIRKRLRSLAFFGLRASFCTCWSVVWCVSILVE